MGIVFTIVGLIGALVMVVNYFANEMWKYNSLGREKESYFDRIERTKDIKVISVLKKGAFVNYHKRNI